MIKLIRQNRSVIIKGADEDTIRAIDAATSYAVAGRRFVKAFKARAWDGREHLLRLRESDGAYIVPSGLLPDVCELLQKVDERFEIVNKTKQFNDFCLFPWNDALPPLRPYQDEAVEEAITRGYGVLKMPARSGKTRTAARVIHRMRLPALFVVPSVFLLHQTRSVLEEAFPNDKIGIIGDSELEIQDITVATPQSLQRLTDEKLDEKCGMTRKQLYERWDVLIIDELHHFTGQGTWHEELYKFAAQYRFGLSATIFPDSDVETERGVIWAHALTGPIIKNVSVSYLIKRGFLMRQHVRMYRCRRPNLWGLKWSATVYDEAISSNRWRNGVAAILAEKYVRSGSKVLIVTNRHEQVRAFEALMDKLDIEYKTLVGKTPKSARERALRLLEKGRIHVIIGTVLGEGVDVPALDVVINVEGGRDEKRSIQRQRNLTVFATKTHCTLIDFYDETNEYTLRHSEERLAAYKSEKAFDVKVVEVK